MLPLTETPFVVAACVAVAAWACAKEEIFREPREWLQGVHKDDKRHWFLRKCAFMPTCEYCCSFWLTLISMLFMEYQVLLNDWRDAGSEDRVSYYLYVEFFSGKTHKLKLTDKEGLREIAGYQAQYASGKEDQAVRRHGFKELLPNWDELRQQV